MTADEFRALLAKLGITQAEAARRLHVCLKTVNNWAGGRHAIRESCALLIRKILLPSRRSSGKSW